MKNSGQKYAYIETFGCQMNERDSETMRQLLAEIDYLPTCDLFQADLILINTCSIRFKAEQKVYSLLGRLKNIKKRRPSLIITVAGCVAQQEREQMPARMPHVDIVVGTQHISRLPELVKKVKKERRPQVAVDLSSSFAIPSYLPPSISENQDPLTDQKKNYTKFVTIMQGCNNFCTYCVVPYTRGREVSRPVDDILSEVAYLSRDGVKEITLLGQNVNSYSSRTTAKGNINARTTFPDLLRAVAEVNGIERLRFTTSHPKDLSEDLLTCFAEIKNLCPHFHLPVQSGSNRILKRMNRKYTIETYLEKVHKLKQIRSDIALSTDIIVGFPGETLEDFEATMSLLVTVRFHNVFSFKYSDRPMVRSATFDDKVSEQEKTQRLSRLQTKQDEITLERNREFVGRRMRIMIEGRSKIPGQWSGRTDTNHLVHFYGQNLVAGEIVEVKIEEACQHSLRGKLLEKKKQPEPVIVPIKKKCGAI